MSREYFYFRKMAVTTVKRWASGEQGKRQERVAEVQGIDQGGGESPGLRELEAASGQTAA